MSYHPLPVSLTPGQACAILGSGIWVQADSCTIHSPLTWEFCSWENFESQCPRADRLARPKEVGRLVLERETVSFGIPYSGSWIMSWHHVASQTTKDEPNEVLSLCPTNTQKPHFCYFQQDQEKTIYLKELLCALEMVFLTRHPFSCCHPFHALGVRAHCISDPVPVLTGTLLSPVIWLPRLQILLGLDVV